MTPPTLDTMTVAQLRDIATRAEARAKDIEREQAEAKQRVKDAKDLVPPVGTEWEYNGRYWVTEKMETDGFVMALSIHKKGGPITLHWFRGGRFSRPGVHARVDDYMDVVTRSPGVIARLALRVRA